MSPTAQTRWPGSSRTGTARHALALTLFGLATIGCPEQTTSPPSPSIPCREVGQRCEYAPGKLGSCVLNDDCKGPDCYICQSQH
jgi:hypothetical protein